jgi:uncharacterized membrane protein
MKVLLAGESWHEISLYVKAQNVTMSSSYTEAGVPHRSAGNRRRIDNIPAVSRRL